MFHKSICSKIVSSSVRPSRSISSRIVSTRIISCISIFRRTSAACFAFLLASAVLSAAQTYTVTAIGVLKGDNESSGFWLNNLGEVVGCSDTATAEDYPCTGLVPGQHAFSWTVSGGIKDLGTLTGATVSGAIGVNDAGTVVGYSNVKGQPATNFVAVEWSPTGTLTNLGTLAGGSSSAAFEINSAGQIAGDSFLSSGLVDATIWNSSKIKNLGGLSKAIFTAGLDINDSGEIVGESVLSYGPPFSSRGFLWNGSTMKNLGTLPGGITSIANAINTSGVIVGQSDGTSTAGNWHAVLWNASDKIQDLGLLVGGNYSVAFAVNDSSVVVGYGNVLGNAPHAFVWTSADGMQDLNSLIPKDSGWVLINANAINNVGQITGYGTRNGYNRAFLLTPVN
jgi:probable HAF family extracellular repeat protein